VSATSSYFVDGEAYELVTGRWSRIAGEIFLDWLALPFGLRWLDVGCGTGAFTEIVLKRGGPRALSGIDPAKDQIGFAKKRDGAERIDYRIGDAQSLPYGDQEFDVAVMALVIGYLPDRLKAMAELRRVVRPGGTIATYVWDGPDTGHPQQPLIDSLKEMGIEFSPMDGDEDRPIGALQTLFERAGLTDLATHTIDVHSSHSLILMSSGTHRTRRPTGSSRQSGKCLRWNSAISRIFFGDGSQRMPRTALPIRRGRMP
jgi:SAM-dependent methyltransferase